MKNIFYCNNVGDMKKETLEDGQIVKTMGFYSGFTGGGALYRIVKKKHSPNLMRFNNYYKQISDLDITFNSEGDITLNGTVDPEVQDINAKFMNLANLPALKPNTTYTASLTRVSGDTDTTRLLIAFGVNNSANGNMISYAPTKGVYPETTRGRITTNEKEGGCSYLQIMCPHAVTFNNFTFHVQLEEGTEVTEWSNADLDPNNELNIVIDDETIAEFIMDGESVNIMQLGYIPGKVDQDCKPAIETYVKLCKRDYHKYELIIPSGKWMFSETDIHNDRVGVRMTGVSSQASGGEYGETTIYPFYENQEYIWNFGKCKDTVEITGGNIVKNFRFTTDWNNSKNVKWSPYGRHFCKTAMLITTCCYSEFDGLYFHSFNGTGLTVQTGWENKFGYLNFRVCGYIGREKTLSALYFKKHPTAQVPSAVSADRFDYINFEGIAGTCIEFDLGSNAVHDEFGDIQVEWSPCNARDFGVEVKEYEVNPDNWADTSEDIEHIYIVKGCAGANYNPMMFDDITISGGDEGITTYAYTDEEGVEHTRRVRKSGIFGQSEIYEQNRYGISVMVANLSCLGKGFPIYHSVQKWLSGTSIKVAHHHGGCIPCKCVNHPWNAVTIGDMYQPQKTNEDGADLIFPRQFRTGEFTYFKDSLDMSNCSLIHGYIKYPVDAESSLSIRCYVDLELDEITSSTVGAYSVIRSSNGNLGCNVLAIAKADFESGKYPLKEWFWYDVPNDRLPLGKFDLEIRTGGTFYLDCIKQHHDTKRLTFKELTWRTCLASLLGVKAICTDRRENAEDELGVMVYRDINGWKSMSGTPIEKLLK